MNTSQTKFGVSYFGNRFLSHGRNDIARISESCDYVVHTVSEADLNYHKAVLTKMFGESRRRGLEVWADPWGLGGVFGGETVSSFLLWHRDSWQIMSDGRVVPSACMNRPEWRSFVKEWVLTVRDMGAQVILWDEPHPAFDVASEWEGVYSCVCSACQQLFRKRYGLAMPAKLNDAAREFRRQTLRDFLSEMMAFAKSKSLKNAMCLYAFKGYPEYDLIWKQAAALPDLDIFGCDPYWRWRGRRYDPAEHVAEFSKKVIENAAPNGKGSQVWIQAMRLPAGTENEIAPAIEAAVKAGITHVAAWSYDGGELLDTVLAERPEQVWAVVESTYKSLRERKLV
jgi:hypothetical protein